MGIIKIMVQTICESEMLVTRHLSPVTVL